MSDAMLCSGGACVDGREPKVVAGDSDVFVAGADVGGCRGVFLVRPGTVVFHWWVEKGLVTLAGSVMSWSPTVDRRDSGTVGRSQAGRLLTGSSEGRRTGGSNEKSGETTNQPSVRPDPKITSLNLCYMKRSNRRT